MFCSAGNSVHQSVWDEAELVRRAAASFMLLYALFWELADFPTGFPVVIVWFSRLFQPGDHIIVLQQTP